MQPTRFRMWLARTFGKRRVTAFRTLGEDGCWETVTVFYDFRGSSYIYSQKRRPIPLGQTIEPGAIFYYDADTRLLPPRVK